MVFGNIFKYEFVGFFDIYKEQGFNEILSSFDCVLISTIELVAVRD